MCVNVSFCACVSGIASGSSRKRKLEPTRTVPCVQETRFDSLTIYKMVLIGLYQVERDFHEFGRSTSNK